MKKIYVMATFLGAGLFAFGQSAQTAQKKISKNTEKVISTNNYSSKAGGQEIWTSDFSTPAEWIMGGDANSQGEWVIGNIADLPESPAYYSPIASSTAANGFAFFAGIDFLLANDVEVQNSWIEMANSIDCNGHQEVTLKFEQAYRAFNTDNTIVEVSLNDGVDWEQAIDVNVLTPSLESTTNNIIFQNFNVNGSSLVKFRFRWENLSDDNEYGSGFAWQVDDVVVTSLADYDLAYISSDYHYDNAQYSQAPADQVSEVTVSTLVENKGKLDLTNIVLNLKEGTTIVASSPAILILPKGEIDSLELKYTPSNAPGIKTYTLELAMTETDDNTSNNAISKEIKLNVSDHTYAADKKIFNEPVKDYKLEVELTTGIVQYQSVGISYDMYSDKEITAVDVQITGGTGNEVTVGVELETVEDITPVASSDPYLIKSSDLGKVITIPLAERTMLNAGSTYRVYINGYGNSEVKLSSSGKTTQSAQISFMKGDGTYTYISNKYEIPMIRMNFDQTVSLENNELSNLNVSQNFPNPFANETTVLFNLKETSNVSYTVVDLTGKVVANVNEGTTMAGDHEITIDGSSFANGVYYLNINAGDSNVTRKMIVNK